MTLDDMFSGMFGDPFGNVFKGDKPACRGCGATDLALKTLPGQPVTAAKYCGACALKRMTQ